MATWRVEQDDGRVSVLYHQGRQATPQRCGSGDATLFPDVLAWCIESAAVADLILVEDAVFARLPTPAPILGRVLAS